MAKLWGRAFADSYRMSRKAMESKISILRLSSMSL